MNLNSKEFFELLRLIERDYVSFLSGLPCIVCFSSGIRTKEGYIQIHHERFSKFFRNEKRATDLQGLPLCFKHHEERHKLGYKKFWTKYAQEPQNSYLYIYTLWKMFFGDCFKYENFDELTGGDSFDTLLLEVVQCYQGR